MKKIQSPHADLIEQYIQDWRETDRPWERWEFFPDSSSSDCPQWYPLVACHPTWNYKTKYRRKATFISINGFQVPEPLRKRLKMNASYFVPNLADPKEPIIYRWAGAQRNFDHLRRGLCHLNRESAIIHGNVLASLFTAKRED